MNVYYLEADRVDSYFVFVFSVSSFNFDVHTMSFDPLHLGEDLADSDYAYSVQFTFK